MSGLYDIAETIGIPGGNEHAIACNVEQRSAEWLGLRCGIITASAACNIITSKGEPTKGLTRARYLCGLMAERITRSVEMHHCTAAMERGNELEVPARDWYAYDADREVRQVGFVYGDAGRMWGCSPDGVCEDRAIEIKCPLRRTHISYLLAGRVPSEYIVQCQFILWITGFQLLDFILWSDVQKIPNAVWPVVPDVQMHARFAEHIPAASAEVEAGVRHIADLK